MSRKSAALDHRKRLLVAEGALLRAEAVNEACKAKAGWMTAARAVSGVLAFFAGSLRRLR